MRYIGIGQEISLDSLKKIGEYVLDATRFIQLPTPAVDTSKERECEGDPPGQRHTNLCRLVVTQLDAGTKYNFDRPLTVPVAVATIRNIGEKTEKHLGMVRETTYAWVIIPGKTTSVGYVNIMNPSDWVPVGTLQRLLLCHGKPHDTTKRVAFYCCDGSCPDAHLKDSLKAGRGNQVWPIGEHTTPPWFSCVVGCCYADF